MNIIENNKYYDDYLIDRLAEAESAVTEQTRLVHDAALALTAANEELGRRVKIREHAAQNLVNWRSLDV